MYICLCKAVSDRQIQRAVRDDGVCSLRELSRLFGLGTGCGKCVPQARDVLADALSARGPQAQAYTQVQTTPDGERTCEAIPRSSSFSISR